ncbi:hypothetical protein M413DRAFT_162267 [Hebeloma cylindrosporum]|uniref:Uncharacterized protein n=1 Tax=Hebeloma cylindrosporum TaxID=76867 RepID=A0A0C3CA48_HEBCY|nr:hypothetical protein M413DRAFT_162267 [Hebeloma cylindrosporum h7]
MDAPSFGKHDRPSGTLELEHIIAFQSLNPVPLFQAEEQGQSDSKDDDPPNGCTDANDNAILFFLVILSAGVRLVDYARGVRGTWGLDSESRGGCLSRLGVHRCRRRGGTGAGR